MGQHCWFSPRRVWVVIHAEMVLWQRTIFAGHFFPDVVSKLIKFIKCRKSDPVIWIDLMLERLWTVEYFNIKNHVFSQATQPRQSDNLKSSFPPFLIFHVNPLSYSDFYWLESTVYQLCVSYNTALLCAVFSQQQHEEVKKNSLNVVTHWIKSSFNYAFVIA